jgi:DNA-binding transcriptional LysR family regulator
LHAVLAQRLQPTLIIRGASKRRGPVPRQTGRGIHQGDSKLNTMPVQTAVRPKLVTPSEPHLDLRVLSQFLIVADTLNMTSAARRMGVSTPAVSQIVLRLESQLGTLLFERNPHGLRLTPAGQFLRERVRRVMEWESATVEDLAGYQDQLLPKLRISMVEPMAIHLMSTIVGQLSPLVGELTVEVGHTVTFVREFVKDELDLIISNEELADIPRLERHLLCTQGMVALVPASVPADQRHPRQLAEALPLIRFKSGTRVDQEVEEYLHGLGIGTHRRISCASPAPMAQLVESGQGWTIAPPLAMSWLARSLKSIAWVPLPPPTPTRDIHLISGEGRFLDLPKTLAERSRQTLAREVNSWRDTALEPCMAVVKIHRQG